MIVIFSGEGPTDLGQSATGTSPCCGADFRPGPMAALVDNAFEARFDYSLFTPGMECAWFISETDLAKRAKEQPKRTMFLRGSKHPEAETGWFFKNAAMLGLFALEKEKECRVVSIAILFRDSDGTRSDPPTLWDSKFKSITAGFTRAQYQRGVAMLPKPKSEAWLLCIAQRLANGQTDCANLEKESGNDNAPNPLKQRLAQALERHFNAEELFEWVKANRTQPNMPSFTAFAQQLQAALKNPA
jgi:hypothetical protein